MEYIGLFSGEEPEDALVQGAFEVLRKRTEGPYVESSDYLQRQFDAMVAYNTMPALTPSE